MQNFVRTLYSWFIKKYYHYLDKKICGVSLGNRIPSKFADLGSYATQSTKYSVLSKVVTALCIKDDDVIVDVGCGKGRLIAYLLYKEVKAKIIGVEIDERVARFCETHLPPNNTVTIITGNIINQLIPDATIYYLFNPFNETVLKEFLKNLELHASKSIKLVYANPVHNNILFENPHCSLVESIAVKNLFNIYDPFRVEIWKFQLV